MSEANAVDHYTALYEDFVGIRALVREAGRSGGRSVAGEHGRGRGAASYGVASISAARGDVDDVPGSVERAVGAVVRCGGGAVSAGQGGA
ncbi:hypothetical protein ACWGH2_13365, partial [Streptomyces sp. NPDC054871]